MPTSFSKILSPERAASDVLDADTLLGAAVREVAGTSGGGPATASKSYALSTLPVRGYNRRRYAQSIYARNICTLADGRVATVVIDEDQHPTLCVRAADSDLWETVLDLRDVPGDPFGVQVDDSHNTYSVIEDAAGYVHIMGNLHTEVMKYARTTTAGNLATFAAATVGGTSDHWDKVSYPDLFLVDGSLMLLYRNGLATQGVTYLQRFNTGTQTWTEVRTVLDGDPSAEGPYSCAALVHEGKFGMFVTWREGGAADTNSGYNFIESADLGATWTRADGTAQPMPMTHANSVDIITLEQGSGFINQCGGAYDENGHPRSGATLYDGDGNTQYNLIHFNGTTWATEQVSAFTTRMETVGLTTLQLVVARPDIVCHNGRDYLIGRATNDGHNGSPLIFDATPGADHRPAPIADMDLAGWEPGAIDLNGLATGKVNMLLTTIDQANDSELNWNRQWLGLLTIDLSHLATLTAGGTRVPTIRALPGAATTQYVAAVGGTVEGDVASSVLAHGNVPARVVGPGCRVFVKLRGRFIFNSGTTTATAYLRAQPVGGALSTEDVCKFTMSSSIQGVWESPWEPLAFTPYVEVDGTRRDTRLVPRFVADNAAGVTVESWSIIVGVLNA